jgi:hypothetical protein
MSEDSYPRYITVKIKSVYGRDLIYPWCEDAKILAEMLCVKTFNEPQLNCVRRLGYRVIDEHGQLLT